MTRDDDKADVRRPNVADTPGGWTRKNYARMKTILLKSRHPGIRE